MITYKENRESLENFLFDQCIGKIKFTLLVSYHHIITN